MNISKEALFQAIGEADKDLILELEQVVRDRKDSIAENNKLDKLDIDLSLSNLPGGCRETREIEGNERGKSKHHTVKL